MAMEKNNIVCNFYAPVTIIKGAKKAVQNIYTKDGKTIVENKFE